MGRGRDRPVELGDGGRRTPGKRVAIAVLVLTIAALQLLYMISLFSVRRPRPGPVT